MNRKWTLQVLGTLATVAAAKSAGAAVVVTHVNYSPGDGGYGPVDLNGDGTKEFDIANNGDGVWMKNHSGKAAFVSASTTPNTVEPLVGTVVGPDLTYAPPSSDSGAQVFLISTKAPTATPFPDDGSTQYVGFRIDDGTGNYNYGAYSVTISPSGKSTLFTTTVGNIYYESTPNTAIDIAAVSVPEPSALAAVAVGAAALLRRRPSRRSLETV